MPFDEKLAERIRQNFISQPNVEEKKMFGGLAFLVNNKMCLCVSGNELMCRFDPDLQELVCEKPGYRTMVMNGRELKGYCYVAAENIRTKKELEYWVKLALDFNPKAKSSKKKK